MRVIRALKDAKDQVDVITAGFDKMIERASDPTVGDNELSMRMRVALKRIGTLFLEMREQDYWTYHTISK